MHFVCLLVLGRLLIIIITITTAKNVYICVVNNSREIEKWNAAFLPSMQQHTNNYNGVSEEEKTNRENENYT